MKNQEPRIKNQEPRCKTSDFRFQTLAEWLRGPQPSDTPFISYNSSKNHFRLIDSQALRLSNPQTYPPQSLKFTSKNQSVTIKLYYYQ